MGWRYECELYMHDDGGWKDGYQGNSLILAVRWILWARREWPNRAYRLVIR
jgi:hypothetical protein